MTCGPQIAQSVAAEPREHVTVPGDRVPLERVAGEVADGVLLPPLRRELGQRLLAGVELHEVVGALERPHLGLERLGVRRAVEGSAALTAGRVVGRARRPR